MDLEILVSINGEKITLNEELDSTIGSIVTSYIKQKISGKQAKKMKVPRANNGVVRTSMKWTAEQQELAINATQSNYPAKSISEIARQIAPMLNKSEATIAYKIKAMALEGRIRGYEGKSTK